MPRATRACANACFSHARASHPNAESHASPPPNGRGERTRSPYVRASVPCRSCRRAALHRPAPDLNQPSLKLMEPAGRTPGQSHPQAFLFWIEQENRCEEEKDLLSDRARSGPPDEICGRARARASTSTIAR
ncbi:protein of unknown function [Paraburkholderia kururiensis]